MGSIAYCLRLDMSLLPLTYLWATPKKIWLRLEKYKCCNDLDITKTNSLIRKFRVMSNHLYIHTLGYKHLAAWLTWEYKICFHNRHYLHTITNYMFLIFIRILILYMPESCYISSMHQIQHLYNMKCMNVGQKELKRLNQ